MSRNQTEAGEDVRRTVLEFVEPNWPSVAEAEKSLEFCAEQIGFIGGRVLPAGGGKPIRLQIFFADDNQVGEKELAVVGLRRRVVWPSLCQTLGIVQP